MSREESKGKMRAKGVVMLVIAILILGLMTWGAVSLTITLVDQIAENQKVENTDNGNN